MYFVISIFSNFFFFFVYRKISGESIPLTQKERCPKRYSNLFFEGRFLSRSLTRLMIAITLWSYELFKLRYTFGLRDKPLTCENFFSFFPIFLGYAITLGSSFHFLHLLFDLQNQVITRYIVEQTRDIKRYPFLIGSRIFLSVSLKLKEQISKSLTTRWTIIPIEGLSGRLWISGKLSMYSKPIIGNGTHCELVG